MVRGRNVLNKITNKKTAAGTISVFLSLILLLILSLLLTVIEGARVTTAKVYTERALTTAMDSVLAEYYGPLWEEYHIFGLYGGGSNEEQKEQKEQMAETLTDYMSYTFIPSKDISGRLIKDGVELYDIKTDQVSLTNTTNLLDYEGEIFFNEAVEYMKYREVGDGIELFLDKLELLETPEKVSYIMAEKQKVDEKLVGIDQSILELMELFDGLNTSKKGLEFTSDGTIATTSTFIKKICYEVITRKAVGINNESLFRAQEYYYINPTSYFGQIDNDFNNIDLIREQTALFDIEKKKQGDLLVEEQAILSELSEIEHKSAQEKRKIQNMKRKIHTIKETINTLETKQIEKAAEIDPLISSIKYTKQTMSKLITEIKPLIKNAITCIDNIIIQTDVAAPLIKQYEELLKTQKDLIDKEVYKGLEEDLAELKKYVSTEDQGYNFKGMKLILERNRDTLTNTEVTLSQAEVELYNSKYQDSKQTFQQGASILSSYKIDDLHLDYSSMLLDSDQADNPFKKASNLLQGGILDLVLDPENISKSVWTSSELLPSDINAMTDKDEDIMSLLKSFFNKGVTDSNFDLKSLFTSLGENSKITTVLGDGINNVAEKVLYQEYLKEHFGMYAAKVKKIKSQKPSVLNYEQEYLLAGKFSDRENLASVVSRIVCLRTILDFASILGDKAKRHEAKLLAASIVGFTGFPILIGIIQILILVVWAFVEALLDTSALLMGKAIPILKKNIGMELPEIFLINREYLQKKASAFVDTKELSFSYQDYLRVFLLLKGKEDLAYRSMDLMQENIRLRYQLEEFRLEQCMFGFEVDAEFIIKEKFTGFNFVRQYLGNQDGYFRYYTKAAYSY